jgi:hypothetical protein
VLSLVLVCCYLIAIHIWQHLIQVPTFSHWLKPMKLGAFKVETSFGTKGITLKIQNWIQNWPQNQLFSCTVNSTITVLLEHNDIVFFFSSTCE